MTTDERPARCRNRLRDEGKSYPKSGCEVCRDGGVRGCPHERDALSELRKLSTNLLLTIEQLAAAGKVSPAQLEQMPDRIIRAVKSEGAFLGFLPTEEVLIWLSGVLMENR